MPNECVLTATDHVRAERDETQDDGPMMLPSAERAAAHRRRGRFMRLVLRDMFLWTRGRLRLFYRRMAESNELRALSDRELRDLGISRYDAEHAARAAFWRAYRGQP